MRDVVTELLREVALVKERGHPLSGSPHNPPGRDTRSVRFQDSLRFRNDESEATFPSV